MAAAWISPARRCTEQPAPAHRMTVSSGGPEMAAATLSSASMVTPVSASASAMASSTP